MSGRPTFACRAALCLGLLTAPAMLCADDAARALDAEFARCLADPRVIASDNVPRPQRAERKDGQKAPQPPGLETVCPALVDAVMASDFGELLPEDWSDGISASRLTELRSALAATESQPGERRLAEDSLRKVLARLDAGAPQAGPTLWQRIKAWLKSLFEREEEANKGNEGWFVRLLRWLHLSTTTAAIINYSLLALLAAAVLAILIIELRAAGVLSRSRSAQRARRDGRKAGTAGSAAVPVDLTVAPLLERPRLLVQMLVEKCVASGRLKERSSLTHRELERAARFEAAADRDSFRGVLAAAEAVRYASRAPDAERLTRAVQDGEALLSRLAGATGGAR